MEEGFCVGLDAEYVPIVVGQSDFPPESSAVQPVCLTYFTSSSGLFGEYWYTGLGIGALLDATQGDLGSFDAMAIKAKVGCNYFIENIGIGLGLNEYLALFPSQPSWGLSSYPGDLLAAVGINMICRFF